MTEDEREYVKARLAEDVGHSGVERNVSFRDVLSCLGEYRIWLGGLMYMGLIVPAYGYAFFAPTILQSYHYDPIQTQLRSVPPWAVSFGFSMIVAALSDWTKHRFLFTVGPICVAIAGFAVLLNVHDDISTQYASLFLTCMGTYSAMPVIVCWFNMNLGGHRRKAIGTAFQIGFGNIGGIIATYSFLQSDAPLYKKGYSISIGFICLSAVSCLLYALSITWENRKRSKNSDASELSDDQKVELGVSLPRLALDSDFVLFLFIHPPPCLPSQPATPST